jgi:D-alanyl-D-alanine carboxypeptidase
MAARKRPSHSAGKIVLILILTAAIGAGIWYLYDQHQLNTALAGNGYSQEQISQLKSSGYARQAADLGPSALLKIALDQGVADDRLAMYLIPDDKLPQDIPAQQYFPILTTLYDAGFTSEQIQTMAEAFTGEELIALAGQDDPYPANADLFFKAVEGGWDLSACQFIASLDSDTANQILDGGIDPDSLQTFTEKGYSNQDALILATSLNDQQSELVTTMKYIPELASLTIIDGFDLDLMPRYLMQMRDHDKTAQEAVSTVNAGGDYISPDNIDWSGLYHDEQEVSDPDSITVLVNKQNYLPDGWEPSDLVYLPDGYYGWYHPMRQAAADAFVQFSDAAVEAGYDRFIAQSNYRSQASQEMIYNRFVDAEGRYLADRESARPQFSEHETGLTSDFGTRALDLNYFESYDGYQWVVDNAHRYGFIQRYPRDREFITGYEFEAWHFRYVGVEVATVIWQHNWTLEEYKLVFD